MQKAGNVLTSPSEVVQNKRQTNDKQIHTECNTIKIHATKHKKKKKKKTA